MSVRISRLPNGLHVVTHAMPHLETVALGIWVKAGARDELPEENGIAHFLEHLAFKGTKRRNAQQIAEEIESSGGEINASTGMETTTYYARVLKNDWALALDILADILTESVFDPTELEREREVILQEIAAANDAPDDLVFDLAQAASFGAHPLGRPILGTSELVEGVTREGIIAWRDRHYCASRMVVAAAGNIDHDQLEAACVRAARAARAGCSADPQPTRFRSFASPGRQASRPDPCRLVICGARISRAGNLCASSAFQPAWRWHVFEAVSGGA